MIVTQCRNRKNPVEPCRILSDKEICSCLLSECVYKFLEKTVNFYCNDFQNMVIYGCGSKDGRRYPRSLVGIEHFRSEKNNKQME